MNYWGLKGLVAKGLALLVKPCCSDVAPESDSVFFGADVPGGRGGEGIIRPVMFGITSL